MTVEPYERCRALRETVREQADVIEAHRRLIRAMLASRNHHCITCDIGGLFCEEGEAIAREEADAMAALPVVDTTREGGADV